MDQEKIGLFIKKIRISNNLSQQKFANMLGVTFQAVSKWENGKNIPDISIMKEISKQFNVEIDEILNGEYKLENKSNNIKKNIFEKKHLIIIFILITLILLTLFSLIIVKLNSNDYNFKILSTNCSNFNITGSIAYNNVKSSIYITNVEYCGGNDNEIYKSIECSLYEKTDNASINISNSKKGINSTLEDYLHNLEFKIDNYSKVCKHFQDNSLYLEIIATNNQNKQISYKIPLKLTENCDK